MNRTTNKLGPYMGKNEIYYFNCIHATFKVLNMFLKLNKLWPK